MPSLPSVSNSLVQRLEQLVPKWTAGEIQEQPQHIPPSIRFVDFEQVLAVCRAWQTEQGWRDIASAPKDGSWIFGYSDTLKIRFYPMVLFWDDNGWTTPSHGDGEPGFNPTHWMPLPDPPVPSPPGTEE